MSFNLMQILDTIGGMLKQELSYHPPGIQENPNSERFSAIGIDSRYRMLTFFYDLVKKIGSSRETAEIAISYLDRFLASPHFGCQALQNKRLFQLASTTCLYVAVKIHELKAMTPSLLADLSHGIFTAKDVESCELVLLQTLQWRLNPPTSLSFVRKYMELLPHKMLSQDTREAVYDLARHQTELALEDPRLFCERKSLIAYIAVQNALKRLQVGADLSDTVGMLLLPEERMSSCQYAGLQQILQVSLATRTLQLTPTCYMSLTPPPPPPPPLQFATSSCSSFYQPIPPTPCTRTPPSKRPARPVSPVTPPGGGRLVVHCVNDTMMT